MRLEQLRYLQDLCETHSLTKTAARFYISPQALSKSMQQLESELRTTLLERSPFGVTLTENGTLFLQELGNFVGKYDTLIEQFENKETVVKEENLLNRINICTSSAIATTLLPKAASEFRAKYPRTIIRIKDIDYSEVFPAMLQNKFDIGFLSINSEFFEQAQNLIGMDSLHCRILLEDQMVACVSSSSQLANREKISWQEMGRHPRTNLNIVSQERQRRVLQNHGVTSDDVTLYSSNDVRFHQEAINELDAIALMPYGVFQQEFNSKRYVARYIENVHHTVYHTAIYPSTNPHKQLIELTNILSSLF